jgi:ABC-type microcin C transport system permease subunit YejE
MWKEFKMNNKWKWDFGIAIALIILLVPLFAQIILNGGYRMMNYSYGWHMPMMYGGGMMGFGMMLVVVLILLGLLILIVLGIAWLVKMLTATR